MQSLLTKMPEVGHFQVPSKKELLALGLWALGLVFLAGSFVYAQPAASFVYGEGQLSSLEVVASGVLSLLALQGFMTMGLVIILRGASRRFGWLMLAAGFTFSLNMFTQVYAVYALLVVPEAELPFRNLAAWVQNLWVVDLSLVFIYLPLLFPDGELPSPRWRRVVWPITIFLSLFVLVLAFADRPLTGLFLDAEATVRNPFGIVPISFIPDSAAQVLILATGLLFAASLLVALSSLAFRWRGAGQETRHQIKWLVYAFGLLVALRLVEWVTSPLLGSSENAIRILTFIRYGEQMAAIGVVAALGIAVLKYRLYDINLIINRTVVYGGLTLGVAGGYVLLVTGLGAFLPWDGSLLPSLLAAGVIAALFAPVRERLQRAVNRLMFGARDEPYEVLSELGRRLARAGPPAATLDAVVEKVGSALKLPYVAIRLEQGGVYKTRAEFGEGSGAGEADRVVFPLTHQNEPVGQLVVSPRVEGETLASRDQQLLQDIAHQVGAVAQAVRLTAELQTSRQRLVTAREEERRRLRRDLHDGLGPTLASQTLKLDTAMDLVRDDPDTALEQLRALHQQTQELVADIRRLVYQLRPPVLDDLGLLGAVRAQIRRDHQRGRRPEIVIEAPAGGLPKLPAAVELAAYRITMEAVTNVIRHSRAERGQVRYELHNGQDQMSLRIEIVDDGQGLSDPPQYGVGMSSMRERAEELGGRFSLDEGEDSGARVYAELPLPQERTA